MTPPCAPPCGRSTWCRAPTASGGQGTTYASRGTCAPWWATTSTSPRSRASGEPHTRICTAGSVQPTSRDPPMWSAGASNFDQGHPRIARPPRRSYAMSVRASPPTPRGLRSTTPRYGGSLGCRPKEIGSWACAGERLHRLPEDALREPGEVPRPLAHGPAGERRLPQVVGRRVRADAQAGRQPPPSERSAERAGP